MEGADPIVWPEQIHSWKEDGLRVVGLSHYGISAYAYGTGTKGGLLPSGKILLGEMEKAGIILDVTHLTDQAFLEAIDAFGGPLLLATATVAPWCLASASSTTTTSRQSSAGVESSVQPWTPGCYSPTGSAAKPPTKT